MDKAMIEYYHNTGQMPDWVYYQVNGKSLEENYIEQTNKFKAKCIERLNKEREKKELEKEIEKQVNIMVEKALDDLLKQLNS